MSIIVLQCKRFLKGGELTRTGGGLVFLSEEMVSQGWWGRRHSAVLEFPVGQRVNSRCWE